jgi:alpha-amylase
MPSGRGKMNYLDFRPNGGPTCLCGDPHSMLFFYDLDQDRQQTRDTLFAYSRYMFQNAGVKGMRVDAVKHFPTWFMGDMLDNLYDNGVSPKMIVGESYDYNPQTLKAWVDEVQNAMNPATKQNMNVRIFDFALREQMRQACDAFGYDVRNLMTSGCVEGAAMSGYNVVSFVNNHDFRDPAQNQLILHDPILPYAYILTNIKLGVPTVFYTDYYGVNNMRGSINALMKAHKKYITGATMVDYLNKIGQSYPHTFTGGFDNTSLLYQVRLGDAHRDVVMAINFAGERMKVDQMINSASVSPGDTLTDIFAVSGQPFTITTLQNYIHIELPPRSFGMWVKGDLRNNLISLTDTLYTATGEKMAKNEVTADNSLQLFPNPNDGNQVALAFESTTSNDAMMTLINTVGQTVWAEKLNIKAGMEVYFMDLPTSLPTGVYFMTMRQNGKLFRQKLVINH